ncbi:MAG: porin [Candidatus Competibacteraceae bacterium]|nr:porin [Candidatus Competibacteraceae bacterium]
MQFRTLALATTSLVALGLAAQANAANQMMGDINFGYGHNWENFEEGGSSSDNEHPSIFGQGRVNLPYSDTVNLQLDAVGRTSLDTREGFFAGKTANAGYFALGGHLNYRDDDGMLGVFAATGRVNDFYFNGAAVYLAGFEGQYYCGPWTFRGQLAYLDSDEFSLLSNAGLARVGANYYIGKNLKLTADLAYVDGDAADSSSTYDSEQWGWGLGVHYWFGKSIPASAFIDYRGRDVETRDGGSPEEIDHQSVNFGVRFHFAATGSPTPTRTARRPTFRTWICTGCGTDVTLMAGW